MRQQTRSHLSLVRGVPRLYLGCKFTNSLYCACQPTHKVQIISKCKLATTTMVTWTLAVVQMATQDRRQHTVYNPSKLKDSYTGIDPIGMHNIIVQKHKQCNGHMRTSNTLLIVHAARAPPLCQSQLVLPVCMSMILSWHLLTTVKCLCLKQNTQTQPFPPPCLIPVQSQADDSNSIRKKISNNRPPKKGWLLLIPMLYLELCFIWKTAVAVPISSSDTNKTLLQFSKR